MSDLDDMFEKFEERKAGEKTEKDKRHELYLKRREVGLRVLNEIILPVLREHADIIQNKGYAAKIREDLTHTFPHVELGFDPDSSRREFPNSYLRFYFRDDEGIQMLRHASFGGQSLKEENKYFQVDRLNKEIIKEEIRVFIGLVLENTIL